MGKKKGGKAPNGRAKQKQKAQKGNTPRSTPRLRSNGMQMLLDDDWEEDTPIHFRGFAQSAPSAQRSAFAKLRHQGISFVSAGMNAPLIQPATSSDNVLRDSEDDITLDDSDDDDTDHEDNIDDNSILTNILLAADMKRSNDGVANLSINPTSSKMEMDEETVTTATSDINIIGVDASPMVLPFVVDTVGDESLVHSASSFARHAPNRAPSPTPSNSSDEVVVFHGRNNKSSVINDPVKQATTSSIPIMPRQPVHPPTAGREQDAAASSLVVGWGAQPSKHDISHKDGSGWTPAPEIPYWKKGKGRAVPRPDLAPSAEEMKQFNETPSKASVVQFTDPSASDIKNTGESVETLRSNWKEALNSKRKLKKPGADFEKLESSAASTPSRRRKHGRKKDNRAMREIITSDDELSQAAYEDYMENLRAQLEEVSDDEKDLSTAATLQASRRVAGPSLVVDGQEISESEVLPPCMEDGVDKGSIKLNDDSEWESDDEELNPDLDEISTDESLNASDVESSELEDDLHYSEKQQWEDEEDLRQRRVDRMTDEQIARLLAKQEELGMSADELLIEDGKYMSAADDGFGDVAEARAGLHDISNLAAIRRANKHGMRRRRDRNNHFPDASTFADTLDQYGQDGFDIMDFDRPSLRPKKKGRKGKLPPELEVLSDEELREDLSNQWAKDRSRKAQKKLEREELRMQGLLGSAGRKGKADLQAKYPLGMDMRAVHDELRSFLQDEELRERAFPPMDKMNRKALHEIAMALNLNSKSQGAGRSRFPIIYKTSRTGEYSNETFGKIIHASSRGFLSNQRTARKFAKKGGTKGPGNGRGGGGLAAASVRHGEIVGAGAAEISQDSFGHKMMLRMGWSKGQALGKDGEGLLVPVEQRMRLGTAGLG